MSASALSPELLAAVREAPMFSELDDAAMHRVIDAGRVTTLPAERFVFRADQSADRFYAVAAGRVKIFKLSMRGDEQILHLYGPGETFGEAAMWAGRTYPAHAAVVEDATLLSVTRDALLRLLTNGPDLAMGMLAGMSRKLHEFASLIEQLSLKEVPARLATVLLDLAERQGSDVVRLPQTKRQLAAQIGTVAETLSRALGRLREAGAIEVRGSNIRLLDADALRHIAEEG